MVCLMWQKVRHNMIAVYVCNERNSVPATATWEVNMRIHDVMLEHPFLSEIERYWHLIKIPSTFLSFNNTHYANINFKRVPCKCNWVVKCFLFMTASVTGNYKHHFLFEYSKYSPWSWLRKRSRYSRPKLKQSMQQIGLANKHHHHVLHNFLYHKKSS